MAQLHLTKTRIHAGKYEALLTTDRTVDAPQLSARHQGRKLDGLHLEPNGDTSKLWNVILQIPADLLCDGVQTILLLDDETGETLDSITLITGEPVSDNLRGEIDLLRAELDTLKRAFRRHCRDTS